MICLLWRVSSTLLFFVLASDEPKGEFAGLGLWLNGVIWSDRNNREQRIRAKQLCIDCLKKGCNLLIFPEGTWNLTPASPMLPLSWGVIEIAQQTGAAIAPVALEYENHHCTVNKGKPYMVAYDDFKDKKERCNELRDTLATLRWECWEMKGTFHHDDVTLKDYEEYSKDRIAEYGLLTESQISSWVLRQEPTSEQVFSFWNELAISKKTAFLFRKNNRG